MGDALSHGGSRFEWRLQHEHRKGVNSAEPRSLLHEMNSYEVLVIRSLVAIGEYLSVWRRSGKDDHLSSFMWIPVILCFQPFHSSDICLRNVLFCKIDVSLLQRLLQRVVRLPLCTSLARPRRKSIELFVFSYLLFLSAYSLWTTSKKRRDVFLLVDERVPYGGPEKSQRAPPAVAGLQIMISVELELLTFKLANFCFSFFLFFLFLLFFSQTCELFWTFELHRTFFQYYI